MMHQPRPKKRHCCDANLLCAAVILAVVLSCAGLGLAGVGFAYSMYGITQKEFIANAVVENNPLNIAVAGAGALTLSLPNNLATYRGRVYTIYATTAHAHKVQITAGTLTTTWDGVNTVATFGGAIGDGLTFVVIDVDQIAVISSTNVVFS